MYVLTAACGLDVMAELSCVFFFFFSRDSPAVLMLFLHAPYVNNTLTEKTSVFSRSDY